MSGWNEFDVQLCAETSGILAGGMTSVCWMNETCGRVLDGSIYSCDHFVDDEHRLGSLALKKSADSISADTNSVGGMT